MVELMQAMSPSFVIEHEQNPGADLHQEEEQGNPAQVVPDPASSGRDSFVPSPFDEGPDRVAIGQPPARIERFTLYERQRSPLP